MIVVIIVFIVIILFLKMKYGTYGGYDFNRFFNQTKQEVLQKNGKPNSRDVLDETCEDINFDCIEYTFGAKYPYVPYFIFINNINAINPIMPTTIITFFTFLLFITFFI